MQLAHRIQDAVHTINKTLLDYVYVKWSKWTLQTILLHYHLPVVGQTSNNNKTEYRNEVENLVNWYDDNNLSLNVNKTKEIVVDFRKQ